MKVNGHVQCAHISMMNQYLIARYVTLKFKIKLELILRNRQTSNGCCNFKISM